MFSMDNLEVLWDTSRQGVLENKLVIYELLKEVTFNLNIKYIRYNLEQLALIEGEDLIEQEIDLAEETLKDLYRKMDIEASKKEKAKANNKEDNKEDEDKSETKEEEVTDFRQNLKFFFQIFFPGISKKKISKETLEIALKKHFKNIIQAKVNGNFESWVDG